MEMYLTSFKMPNALAKGGGVYDDIMLTNKSYQLKKPY